MIAPTLLLARHDLYMRPRPWRPGIVANTHLEGTYSEVYPEIRRDADRRLRKLFRQFSFPGGIMSQPAPGGSMRAANSASPACIGRDSRLKGSGIKCQQNVQQKLAIVEDR
jgi:hypothetical protein